MSGLILLFLVAHVLGNGSMGKLDSKPQIQFVGDSAGSPGEVRFLHLGG